MASGHCDFCGIWHSGSCCHPGRAKLQDLEQQVATLTGQLEAAEQHVRILQDSIRGHGEERERLMVRVDRLTAELAQVRQERVHAVDRWEKTRNGQLARIALERADAAESQLAALRAGVPIVLDAARQHANNDEAWKSVSGTAYFESNLMRAEHRQKLREAIKALSQLLTEPAEQQEKKDHARVDTTGDSDDSPTAPAD